MKKLFLIYILTYTHKKLFYYRLENIKKLSAVEWSELIELNSRISRCIKIIKDNE